MDIAIVNEYVHSSVNYGNVLQSYALCHYIKNINPDFGVKLVETVSHPNNYIQTKSYPMHILALKTFNKIKRVFLDTKKFRGMDERLDLFKKFLEQYVPLSENAVDYSGFKSLNFNTYIVGSDVVWFQEKNRINRIKFFDFKKKAGTRKISYAASFGCDWIPEENIKEIQRCLTDFDAVSVRENSSVELLKSIGINAVHVLDPTFLLDAEEWSSIEKLPINSKYANLDNNTNCLSIHDGLNYNNFIFAYILGTDADMRTAIMNWAEEKKLKVVAIPYASGKYNNVDENFGHIQVYDCSPQNWIWLIHHAEYIITDSFHGTAFSTIYRKKFVVLERMTSTDLNNRMLDYLKTIKQLDKMISFTELYRIDDMCWNYDMIYDIL